MQLIKKTVIICILLFITLLPQKAKIELTNIFPNKIVKNGALDGLQWKKDSRHFTFQQNNKELNCIEIIEQDVNSGSRKTLLSAADLKVPGEDKAVELSTYTWSPDEANILITGKLIARKLKTGGTFYLYNVAQKRISKVIESDEEQENIDFSPDGKFVSFVRGNNLFVYDISKDKIKKLTSDGNANILNGIFDWAYEEEFSIIRAYTWSQDSKQIAFWRTDQSNEPEVQIQKYDSLYMNSAKTRYPKAGGNIGLVTIGVFDIPSGKTTWMNLGKETNQYIPRIEFTHQPGQLSIQRLDRLQHKNELLLAETKTGNTKVIITESDSCWVEIDDNLIFLKDNKSFLWTSERDGFNHIYLIHKSGTVIRQLTKGDWEVQKITGVDEKNETVFFTANKRATRNIDLYSVKLDGTGLQLITSEEGTHVPTLSPDCSYFINKFSSTRSPIGYSLKKITNEKVLDITGADTSCFEKFNLGTTTFRSFTTTDNAQLNSYMITPPDFDTTKKYPVLIYCYGGPGSLEVKDEWGGAFFLWHNMMAQKGYIIFVLDNRGTRGRGKEFKHIGYKNLGDWEVHDEIEGAKYLASLPYVDASRIGIWGWSYGGYTSAMTILQGAVYFKAAVSVAPVTDWKFYDAPYTERFMSTPALNPVGYEKSSVMNYTDRLKGKWLIVHGTADDNVHFQNSVKLVEKLISDGKQFQTMFYPEKTHSITGNATRLHLFTMITDFILKNL